MFGASIAAVLRTLPVLFPFCHLWLFVSLEDFYFRLVIFLLLLCCDHYGTTTKSFK